MTYQCDTLIRIVQYSSYVYVYAESGTSNSSAHELRRRKVDRIKVQLGLLCSEGGWILDDKHTGKTGFLIEKKN